MKNMVNSIMTSTKYLTQVIEQGKNKLILNKYSNQNQQTNGECLMCWAPPMINLFLHELIPYISLFLNCKIVFMLIKNMKIGKKKKSSKSKKICERCLSEKKNDR